ncbi:hypothetical protein ACFOS2_09765 [Bacillus chungangensis]|uniref:Uncharacterized protein n=1 Tax=Bacillus chungangensis TaxID=587633 RepID=A0ABT9WXE0_9BACI|nr:hypothetical protein [Bacillus chungangensis]
MSLTDMMFDMRVHDESILVQSKMVLKNVYVMGFFSVDRLFTLSYNAAMPSSQDGFIAC